MTPRRLARGLAVALSCLLTNGCVDWTYDHLLNRVEDAPRPTPTAEERKFHDDLFIADLHADTLMWDRDLLSEHGYGHIDLPRLQRGNVRLQVFSVVTKTPIDAT
jgi:membrane dipeptidase